MKKDFGNENANNRMLLTFQILRTVPVAILYETKFRIVLDFKLETRWGVIIFTKIKLAFESKVQMQVEILYNQIINNESTVADYYLYIQGVFFIH